MAGQPDWTGGSIIFGVRRPIRKGQPYLSNSLKILEGVNGKRMKSFARKVSSRGKFLAPILSCIGAL